MIKRWF
ncbi:exonuclease family protein, partial [Vibrio parahaemolyticus V-223/04]